MESNKLIAVFEGLDVTTDGISDLYYDENGTLNRVKRYDKHWNDLMPVVAKITRDENYWENDYREHLMDIIPYGHIEDTYEAVVNFIKEYNKPKQR
jgi:hypothetical protein